MARVTAIEVVDHLMEDDEHFKELSKLIARFHLEDLSSRTFARHVRALLESAEESVHSQREKDIESERKLYLVDKSKSNPGAA